MAGNKPWIAIAIAAMVVLSLIVATYVALQLIWAGKDIANGIIEAVAASGGDTPGQTAEGEDPSTPTTPGQPDALTNGWLVVATAFVAGVAPLIALGAAVGRAFAGGNPGGRSNSGGGGNTGSGGNSGRAPSPPSILSVEPAVSATAVATIVQLFVLLSGTPDVSPETQAAIVAGLTGLAGLYIRQKEPTR